VTPPTTKRRTPIVGGLLQDGRVEVGTSAMLLAIAVVVARARPAAGPALLLPFVAVHQASRSKVEADTRRAQAETLAEQQRRVATAAATAVTPPCSGAWLATYAPTAW
jgi:hypothetical protein